MHMNWVIVFSILNSIFNGTAAIIFKKKLIHQKISALEDFVFFLFDPIIIFSCLLVVISMYFSIRTLSLAKLSIGLPLIFSINLIFTSLAGIIFFQEKINQNSGFGLLLILIGIFFLTKK